VSAVLWVLAASGVPVLAGLVTLLVTRARRLDRLHIRTDAARAGLERALRRRATAALTVVAALEAGGRDAGGVRAAAVRAAGAERGDREGAENVLGRKLAAMSRDALPAAVLEDLADAEQMVVLARRVYNDAVRDTRELRSRRLVRWLHLAGTAPMPDYFEIVDVETGVTPAAPARPPVTPPA